MRGPIHDRAYRHLWPLLLRPVARRLDQGQVRFCRAHAERQGWQVVRVFEDRAISGASAILPGYQAMLEAVQSGTVDIVLAESLDRLSRDQEDIAALFKRLRFLGVKLVTVGEGDRSPSKNWRP